MSSSETFYWHDYETTGADPALDRPVQFAGVRTNSQLEVIGEPLVIYNRPTPDVLPHPGAVRVTGISPYTALEEGLSECDFIEAIHAELSQPGTCGVGYNSIRFDDEVSRYTLYRNFFDPYERERGQGRSRWDLLDVTRAFFALRPEGIEWPNRDDGLTSFRLEELTAANGIDHGAAHDALSDVLATIALGRLLQQRHPDLWAATLACRDRNTVADLVDPIAMKPFLHVSGMLGAARGNLAVMLPLAVHPVIKSEVICVDLEGAPDFLDWEPAQIAEALFSKTEDLPPGTERPPLKTLRLNRAPVVLPMQPWADRHLAERWGWDGDRQRAHLARYREARGLDATAFAQKLGAVFGERSFAPRTDPDAMLYYGFFDRPDKDQFSAVRQTPPDALGARSWVFSDPRLPELLFRYRARNYPETLNAEEQARWREHCALQLRDGPFNWEAFDRELAEVQTEPLSERQADALAALANYRDELAQYLA